MPSPGEQPLLPITPLPEALALAQPQEMILFGGSFDPPHLAHIAVANLARDTACINPQHTWICLIPAARSPHKSTGPTASASQRLDMLHLLLEDLPRTVVWADEINRAQASQSFSTNSGPTSSPSYTIDTIERLRILLPSARLYLLLGEDQAKSFHRWHRPNDILAQVQPLVALRGDPSDLLHEIKAAHPWTPSHMESWSRGLLNNTRMDVSSTAIRHRLGLINNDLARDAWLSARISQPVLEYIDKHNLYRTSLG